MKQLQHAQLRFGVFRKHLRVSMALTYRVETKCWFDDIDA